MRTIRESSQNRRIVPVLYLAFLVFVSDLFFAFAGDAAKPKPDEAARLKPDEVRAGILVKLPGYIKWSPQSLSGSSNLVLVVLGNDPINGLLEGLVKKLKLDGRDVVLRVIKNGEPIPKCHILFVPSEGFSSWEEWVKGSDTQGTLTVGESDEFLRTGGIFKISMAEPKLVTHLSNARKAGIEINSKLLKICKIYPEAGR